NFDAWHKFAERIGAIVIEDFYDQPIPLHDRVALYAGAKMNFGVCNGPMALVSLTEYPAAIVVNTQSAINSLRRWSIDPKAKFPWMRSNQTVICQDDSFENLCRMFDRMGLR